MDRDPSAQEQAIRRRAELGDAAGATTLALTVYGPEILRFLISVLRSEDAASEVFSLVAEGLWCGMERFTWEGSVRAWAYGIARRAALRHRRDEGRRRRRQVPIEALSALSAIEADVRTRTLSFLRTEVKSRFAELRESLPPD